MRPKGPHIATFNQVRIRRTGESAVIEYLDPAILPVVISIGPDADRLSDADLLDRHNAHLREAEALTKGRQHVVVEIPPGRRQIEYSVARGHWAPRGGRNPSSMITLLLSLPLRRLSSARPREPSLAPAVRRVQENGDPAETAHDRSALLAHVDDSDVDDVKGARAAGLRVAWVNRDRRSHHPDVPQPDFEIPDLTELLTPL